MNFRHAAALALVGWYLMIPPSLADTWVCRQSVSAELARGWFGWGKDCETMARAFVPDAPLSQWHQGAPFETLAECEADRQTLHKYSESGTPSFNAECFAADDPRLE
ncbi:hypothetical protein [Candidatus Binatus sp.]|uniref:hypothetical protein n=1 Tax=Candidatus Binatus sp. TaxID=2811406 RepID=UPI002F94CAF0